MPWVPPPGAEGRAGAVRRGPAGRWARADARPAGQAGRPRAVHVRCACVLRPRGGASGVRSWCPWRGGGWWGPR